MRAQRERLRPVALVCLLIVVALAVGALHRTPSRSGNSDLLGSATEVIALAVLGVCTVITAIVLVSQLLSVRRRKDDDDPPETVYRSPMSRWARLALMMVTAALIAGVGALVVLVVSHLGEHTGEPARPGQHPLGPTLAPRIEQHPAASGGSGISPEMIIAGVLIVVVLAGLGYAVYRGTRPVEPIDASEREQVRTRARLVAAVDDADRALAAETEPRAAIIACYRAMESSLGTAGVEHRVTDAPEDFLSRAAGSGIALPDAAWQLTELFREARYSTHPMTADQRERAAGALARLRAELVVG